MFGVGFSPQTAMKLFFTILSALLFAPLAAHAVAPTSLKTEFLESPLGLGTDKPRLSWIVEDAAPGAKQTAYQVQAASSPEKLAKGAADLWDSGKVASDQSHLVEFAGKPLSSRQKVWWRVKSWDKDGKDTGWSVPVHFEIGLLDATDWKAQWIKAPGATNIDNEVTRRWRQMAIPPVAVNIQNLHNVAPVPAEAVERAKKVIEESLNAVDPAPLFRKSFTLNAKPQQARAYVCGLGLVELRINGRKVSEDMFAPAATPYEEQAYSLTYDVTSYLRDGENVITAIISPGQYNQPVAFATAQMVYGAELPFILQLEALLSDGKRVTLGTDETWKTSIGPVLKSHFWIGEAYDATRLEPGWDAPGFSDTAWTPAETISAPTKKLVPQMMPRERIIEKVKAVALTEPRPGVWVFKFPKAITGMVELRVKEQRGTPVCLRYSERLFNPKYPRYTTVQSVLHYDNFSPTKEEAARWGLIGPSRMGVGIPGNVPLKDYGRLNRVTFQTATPTDLYVTSGDGTETWHRRGAYTPFQFVEVTGLSYPPKLDDVTALVVHADVPKTGTFTSTNPLFESIIDASDRSLIYCTHETIQDNPGREKGCYPVMAILNEELAVYNRDYAQVFRKILDDYRHNIRDEFGRPRKKPITYRGKSDMEDDIYHEYAAAILPMTQYRHYGDKQAVDRSYAFAKGFLNYYLQNPKFTSPLHGGKWGDYAAQLAYEDIDKKSYQAVFKYQNQTIEFVESAKLYESCHSVAAMADLLGKSDDAKLYRNLAEQVGAALNKKYYDPEKKTYGLQALNSLAVMLGFAPAADRQIIADNTVRDMNERFKGHFALGHHTIQFLFQMLSEYGHVEKAYEQMNHTNYPGLGNMLTFGTGTIMDQWPSPDGEPPIAGIVQCENTGHVEWFYKYLCGIRPDDTQGGYKHFFLAPVFPQNLGSAGMEFQSPYGQIASAWKREGNSVSWNVTVPWNTTATVKLPGVTKITVNGKPQEKSPFDLPAGKWEIVAKQNKEPK